jgi:hypothetical protein
MGSAMAHYGISVPDGQLACVSVESVEGRSYLGAMAFLDSVGFGAAIFDARVDPREGDPNDLRGGRRAARRFVEWETFFDFGTQEIDPDTGNARNKVKRNKRIDPFISFPMFDLSVGSGWSIQTTV